MQKQQEQSGKKLTDSLDHIELDASITTEFTGYQELETPSAVIALIVANEPTDFVPAEQECWVIARKSPFFIVGGGQVPDQGSLTLGKHKVAIDEVRYINGRIAARIKAPIDIKIGDAISSKVDKEWRTNAMKNHTATHLLQAALIQLLGKHIKQSGSLVHPDYLRFDFTYHENLSPEQIKKVENVVNEKIRQNIPVKIEHTTFKDATDRGVLAFFGDKYNPEKVRIVEIPEFSAELCGGTHVRTTGDIGAFKITEVTALSAGHRRIVALTGPKAIELFQDTFSTVKNLSQEFKVKREEVIGQVLKQKEQLKELQTQVKQLRHTLWQTQLPIWKKQTAKINDLPFLFLSLQDAAHDELKDIAQSLAQKTPGLYFLISATDDRSIFLATLSDQFANRVNLKNFAAWLKDEYGLRGGGTKNSIQGGGGKFDPELETAITAWLK